MIVTYSPEGEPVRRFEFLPDRVRSKRAEDIERAAGTASTPMAFDEWVLAVQQGSARARRVLVWHLLSLAHPKLRLADVDFAMGEMTVEMTLPELLELREQTATSRRLKPEQREEALELIDADIETEREKVEATSPVPLVDGRHAEADMRSAYAAVAGDQVQPYDGGDLAADGLGKAR